MNEMLIRVAGLGRSFGEIAAVTELSFEVGAGELFGLVGPDGAGKTTTLRMLAGVLRPSRGDALLAGASISKDPEAVKAQLAYMPQRFGLYTDLTVSENLEFYADLFGVPRAERSHRLERLYRFSNLGEFKDRLAGQLSGGMKQKLGLSCALIHQPRILLLDEPTFGVDPISRRDLWLIVHEMVAEGVTAIVSTAYMDEAERFDRLVLMHKGRTIALDTPAALQGQVDGRLLAVEVDRVREAGLVLDAHPLARGVAVFGDKLHVNVAADRDVGPEFRSRLESAGFQVAGIIPIEPTLEDVFMARVAAAEAA